ncbi:dipeptide tripeptide transport protein [Paucilactobacillus oligofermentans DSM 15707 = LMG 22743]|uniref:Dipeptide tripeptide transport protein n=2 Tax=Paucilactobacillus oligofermentans TaxID=293371 RepID=A0A0R1RX31_9LACO|nr:dipeptide tripeptide transport protein [Paucilactobacillus oligofermentans DSM 15707 = LMG 22743]
MGQPRGLATLFLTETWERFSYYGMRAILIYYMIQAVQYGGLGFDQTTAASIMSIYGSLVYMTGVIGGWLSDRIWGSRRTVFIGGVLIMLGHIALSIPGGTPALFSSIGLIVIGTGLLKPNISAIIGGLYSETDRRRDAGFSLFVFGANFGAAVAPIVVPWASDGFGIKLFGSHIDYHAGFALAAIGMFFGLLQYYFDGKKYLPSNGLYPKDPIERENLRPIITWSLIVVIAIAAVFGLLAITGNLNIESVIWLITIVAIAIPVVYFTTMLNSRKVNKVEKSRVWAYIPLFIASAMFWAIEESGSTILALFAANRTVLHLGGWHFQPANFQILNPLFIMLLTPLFIVIWSRWKNQPSAPGKFSGGLMIAGLSYVFIALPGLLYGTDGKVSPLWLVGSWFIVEIAEMLISPIGLSVTTKLAPKAFTAQMISMWMLSDSVGQAVNAQIVKFYTPGTEVQYFLAVGGASILLGLILLLFTKPIHKLMAGVD